MFPFTKEKTPNEKQESKRQNVKAVKFNLPSDVHLAMKVKVAQQSTTIQKVIENLVREWLK